VPASLSVRVDGQHGEAVQCLAYGIAPCRPHAGHAQRFAYGVAGTLVGLEEGFDRDDAVLGLTPGDPEAGFVGYGFGAGVVGVAGDFGVGDPVRDQAKAAQQRFAVRHRVIAHVGIGWRRMKMLR